jgi:hypothetical protein
LITGAVIVAPKLLISGENDAIRSNKIIDKVYSDKFTWTDEIVQRISKIKDIIIYPGYNHIVVKVEKPDYYQKTDVVEFVISKKNRIGYVVGKSEDHIIIKSIYNKFPNAINNAEYLRTIGNLAKG